jgi:hypothetical protein
MAEDMAGDKGMSWGKAFGIALVALVFFVVVAYLLEAVTEALR